MAQRNALLDLAPKRGTLSFMEDQLEDFDPLASYKLAVPGVAGLAQALISPLETAKGVGSWLYDTAIGEPLEAGQRSFDAVKAKSAGVMPGGYADDSGQQYSEGNPSLDAFMAASLAPLGGVAAHAVKDVGDVGMFAGKAAKTADHAKLAKAQSMAAEGAPREKIWNDTGWFQGADGQWRHEIGDSRDELLAAYPSYGSVAEKTAVTGKPFDDAGSFSAGTGITPVDWLLGLPSIKAAAGSTPRMKSVLAHERQHFVQDQEGFAGGGTLWDVGRGNYGQMAGEVEARAVQKRLNMPPDERSSRAPWLDYDVPEERQLFSNSDEAATAPMLARALESELPMDQASRLARAREMGFNVEQPLYHGTLNDISAFDLSRVRATGEPDVAVALSSSPHLASSYAGARDAASPWDWQSLENSTRVNADEGGNVVPTFVRGQYMPVQQKDWLSRARNADLLEQAKSLGFDGVDFTYTAYNPPLREFLVSDPSNIRSANAAFDPAQSGSANLLAANPDNAASVPMLARALEEQGYSTEDILALLSQGAR